MKIKKTFMLALPLLGLAATGLAALSNSNKAVSKVDAADYSTSANGFELNAQDNSVSATFTVTNSTLSMRGWLLCLLTEKPAYDVNTRKLNGSNDLHPYTYNHCVHYFSSSYTGNSEGEMSITWAAKSADQKSSWGTDIDEENNLAKYMADENNYYIAESLNTTKGVVATTVKRSDLVHNSIYKYVVLMDGVYKEQGNYSSYWK